MLFESHDLFACPICSWTDTMCADLYDSSSVTFQKGMKIYDLLDKKKNAQVPSSVHEYLLVESKLQNCLKFFDSLTVF